VSGFRIKEECWKNYWIICTYYCICTALRNEESNETDIIIEEEEEEKELGYKRRK